MGFFDHLEDLRGTLIKCAVVFVVFAVAIGFFLREFHSTLLWPLHHVQAQNAQISVDLGTTSAMEAFSVVLQLCCGGAFVLAAPFCLFFVGQFIAPALTAKEMRLLLPTCIAAALLFLLGASFSFFFLVPSTIRVSAELNALFGFVMRWTPGSYYSLLIWLVLGVGASFEFPLVIVLLVYLGLMTVETLRRYRRHAIVAIFILAAVVTPTSDPFTQTMFAAPLYVLFELAILVGARVQKRRPLAPTAA
jgi:sec-independent protein translocase protein TatC